jgi:hypothetical protein
MKWVRMLLEVIAHELVKLLDRPDSVLADPEPELDSFDAPDLDSVLDRYDGVSD